MEIVGKNGRTFLVREYNENNFDDIQELNRSENWSNLIEKADDTKHAWANSNVALVVLDHNQIIGYVRGVTDKFISLYICELLVKSNYRGLQIGQELLKYVHSLYPKTRMELLASNTSRTFYDSLKYRPFYGYRKTFEEQ